MRVCEDVPLAFCSLFLEVCTKSLYYDIAIFVFLCMEIFDLKHEVDMLSDDFDDGECGDGRSRTWMLLLYPDNEDHKHVLDVVLPDLDWNYAGRVHDMDPGVKAHHHVVVVFKDGRKAEDVAADLGLTTRWLRSKDKRTGKNIHKKKAFRYLCHKDSPDKYQYTTDLIYGTIAEQAISACSKGDLQSEQQSVEELLDLIESLDTAVSYRYFLSLVNKKGLFSVFRRMGNLGLKLLDEHNATFEPVYGFDVDHDVAIKNYERNAPYDTFLAYVHGYENGIKHFQLNDGESGGDEY